LSPARRSFFYASENASLHVEKIDLRAGLKEFDSLPISMEFVLHRDLVEDLTRYLNLLKVGGVLVFEQVTRGNQHGECSCSHRPPVPEHRAMGK